MQDNLEAFATDLDLRQLERSLDQFNVFVATGIHRLEVHHSNVLAYLLDPNHKHGLEADFLERFLLVALGNSAPRDNGIGAVDVAGWRLRDAAVRREYRNTDILIECDQMVAVIENKIDSGEHDDQLNRYWQSCSQDLRGRKMLLLYLTPAGLRPVGKGAEHWRAVSYKDVARALDDVLKLSRGRHIEEDVALFLRHYLDVLRRYIVADSEDALRYRDLYRKHRAAIDFLGRQMADHRERLKQEARQYLKKAIEADTSCFELDSVVYGTEVRFFLRDVDHLVPKHGTETPCQRLIMLYFTVDQNGSNFSVMVGPGHNETREKIFDMASNQKNFLRPLVNREAFLKQKWNTIYKRQLTDPDDYSLECADFLAKLEAQWNILRSEVVPEISAAFQAFSTLPASSSGAASGSAT